LKQKLTLHTTVALYEKVVELTTSKKMGVNLSLLKYRYLYILHKIIVNKTFNKGEYSGCPLHIADLTVSFGGNHQNTSSIVRDLVESGCISRLRNHHVGKHARKYVLGDQYDNTRFTTIKFSQIEQQTSNKPVVEDSTGKVVKQLSENMKLLSINKMGIEYINNKYGINIYTIINRSNIIDNNHYNNDSIIHTIHGSITDEAAFNMARTPNLEVSTILFLFEGVSFDLVDLPLIDIILCQYRWSRKDPKSRLYNNITHLKREFRKYVHFNDVPMSMTDISNCQVLLSVSKVIKQYAQVSGHGAATLPGDICKYKALAESGMFYEYLIAESKYIGDRNTFKKDFFAQVFFSKVVSYSMPIKDAFVTAFPTVYAMINHLKANDYRDFAISLQRLEASIIIDKVAKKMIQLGRCVLTLHDAIVTCNDKDLDLAEELINKAMVKLGITPKFKRECESGLVESKQAGYHLPGVYKEIPMTRAV
jgi:hypothetical protein